MPDEFERGLQRPAQLYRAAKGYTRRHARRHRAAAPRVRELGMIWHHLPIPDGGVPDARFDARWQLARPWLCEILRRVDRAVVH